MCGEYEVGGNVSHIWKMTKWLSKKGRRGKVIPHENNT